MQEPDAGRKDIENRTGSGSRQKQTEKERTYYMELAICSFASSSSGNSFLIQSSTTRIIADVGVSMKKMDESLKQCDLSYEEIDGVVITHDHVDHVKGINTMLSRRPYTSPVYITQGTRTYIAEKHPALGDECFQIIRGGQQFPVGDIRVSAFNISHDASEPVGFTFEKAGKKIAIVTDTGCVTEDIFQAIRGSDILVLEANHEKNILLYGKYPYSVKHRILSDKGHLSNETAGQVLCRYLEDIGGAKVPKVCLAHLSKENNSPEQAFLTVRNVLEEGGFYVGKDLEMEIAQKEGISSMLIV